MTTEDVVIVGGGPTGLLLAAELWAAGIRPVVLERLPEISPIPKGNGLVGQIVPMLDHRGLLDRCRAEGTWAGPVPRFQFGAMELNFSRLGVSPLQVLAIPQRRLEYVLDERLRELGGSVRRGHEVIAFDLADAVADDAAADRFVTLDVRGPEGEYQLRTRFLVGCDGAHSQVRKQAGIGFPGVTSGEISRIARVSLPADLIVPGTGELDVPGVGRLRPTTRTRNARGGFSFSPLAMLDKEAGPDVFILSTSEDQGSDQDGSGAPDRTEPMTLAEFAASVARVLGAELPMSRPQWLTRTVANSRQADRYRAGRVLLAGDAAHLFGIGGSLNAGLSDALNLGWKLAAEVRGTAPAGLLDSYHAERHAAGARILMSTTAQRFLAGPAEEAVALRTLIGELAEYAEPLRHLGKLIQGSDLRYPTGPAGRVRVHPLQGLFVPDFSLETSEGTTRVAELTRAARPVLLDLSGTVKSQAGVEKSGFSAAETAAPWRDRVHIVEGLPVAGGVPIPATAVLIRPDGYVAWAAGPDEPGRNDPDPDGGLRETLEFWFGAPGRIDGT